MALELQSHIIAFLSKDNNCHVYWFSREDIEAARPGRVPGKIFTDYWNRLTYYATRHFIGLLGLVPICCQMAYRARQETNLRLAFGISSPFSSWKSSNESSRPLLAWWSNSSRRSALFFYMYIQSQDWLKTRCGIMDTVEAAERECGTILRIAGEFFPFRLG